MPDGNPIRATRVNHGPINALVSPQIFERAQRALTARIAERRASALMMTFELTAIGATGFHAPTKGEALVEDMADMLTRCLRQRDVVARTGDLEFNAIVSPIPALDSEHVIRRFSLNIEGFLRRWRTRGVIAYCAVSHEFLGHRAIAISSSVSGRRRHVMLSSPPGGEVAA